MKIQPYEPKDRESLLYIWEKSVLATHHFLQHSDFLEIKEMLQNLDFGFFTIFMLSNEDEKIGFVALHESKIEMLFLDPNYTGKGLGAKLVNYVKSAHGANAVDVNEQNINAKVFYEKLGFKTFSRSEKDEQGKDYPILKMKL